MKQRKKHLAFSAPKSNDEKYQIHFWAIVEVYFASVLKNMLLFTELGVDTQWFRRCICKTSGHQNKQQ
jgi:hypothetical protein